MKTVENDFDDVGEAVREGRPLALAKAYRIKLGINGINFNNVQVADPVPTGRQILESANLNSRDDYVLIAILDSGDFEDIRLDETFDLRQKGAERFIVFKTDREFKFKLNDRQLIWGDPTLPAEVLYTLSEVEPGEAIFKDVRGGEDILIERNETVDLNAPGVERFITAPRPIKGYVIIVNSREETVNHKRVTFEQVIQLSHPNAPPDTNVRFSMTYRNAASKPHAGELGEGGSIEVKKEGTIFNVTRTVQS
jgi:hypothetical protein